MRYSYTALVLATFTLGQALAGPVKHAHQHLHKKHDEVLEVKAEEKRDGGIWQGVNFATVSITYSKGQTWGDATAAPAAPPAATPATTKAPVAAVEKKPATTPASVAPAPSSSSSSAAAAVSSKAATPSSGLKQQTNILSEVAKSLLTGLGAQLGTNSLTNNGAVWIGDDGFATADIINDSGEEIVITCWGPDGSWINAKAPLITHSVDPGATFTLSFASGISGSCSAFYEDTKLVNGQCSNTWFEFTFGPISVFDVSREVNMNGHSVSLVGDICTSDMETCVFKCGNGEDVCTFGYELDNCTPGSQQGAEYGLDFGAPSGGCRLGDNKHIKATFS